MHVDLFLFEFLWLVSSLLALEEFILNFSIMKFSASLQSGTQGHYWSHFTFSLEGTFFPIGFDLKLDLDPLSLTI